MFGWRRKGDGFEWHKYVRTTIKLRREDRRRKLDEIKVAAAANAAHAGRASVDAGRSAVTHTGHWLWLGLKSLGRIPGLVGRAIFRLAALSLPFWSWLADRINHAMPLLVRPGIRPMLALVAGAAAASAAAGLAVSGFDTAVLLSMCVALFLLSLAVLPTLVRFGPAGRDGRHSAQAGTGDGVGRSMWPAVGGLPRGIAQASAGAVALLMIGAGVWWSAPGAGSISSRSWLSLPDLGLSETTESISKLSPFASQSLTGRAGAVSGDTLTLQGKTVQLAGIEAPELAQRCRDARRRRWRCGSSARSALGRLVAGKTVTCSISAHDKSKQIMTGRCKVGDRDLGQRLVSRGHVFASGGFYASYASAEREARRAKRGIWRGSAQKPADYRTATWDRAKRRAPGGCPIKGRVRRGAKTYVVPWATNYRRVQVRTRRGERWFCSESEALAAGWQPDSAV